MSSHWMQTATGKIFDFENPTPEMIDPVDITLALARTARFNGHVPFYSVAQHSLMVSVYGTEENALIGLLHDATEAYIGDMVAPLKRLPGMEAYRELEAKIWRCIAIRFGLPMAIPPEVKETDLRMLATEKEIFIPQEAKPWELGVEPYSLKTLRRQTMGLTAHMFMTRWGNLQPGVFNDTLEHMIWEAAC